jgi:hypothetical protein
MTDQPTPSNGGPTGDVQYDEGALRDAEEKMHAHRDGMGQPENLDPEESHDPEALKDADRKMTNRS